MHSPNSKTNAELIRTTLGRVIDPAIPVALIDYPEHSNVGDSAIWAGETKFLRDGNYDLRYICDHAYFSEAALRRLMPRGQILLHGGGNFGTVWPRYQAFRESIAKKFPDYRLVQLPQSLHFDDEASAGKACDAFSQHPDFLLLTRDRESLQFAQQHLKVRAELCPDSALLLQGILVRRTPEVDVLVLARTDKEAKNDGLRNFSVEGYSCRVVDWLEEPKSMTRRYARLAKMLSTGPLASLSAFQSTHAHLFQALANARIERGVRLLSQGRIVVTDRLHAHIVCLILGIPHVVLDNSYGKLSRFISCWTASSDLVSVVKTGDEAVLAAKKLLSR